MRFFVTQENFSKALSVVSRVAGGRTSTLPILANILIKTVNNRLQISATNLEVAVTQNIGAKVEKEGSITVPARLISDFVSSLPKGNIEAELKDNKLTITTDKYTSTINGVVADEFPTIPTISGGDEIKIAKKELFQSINQTVIAASNDEARPVLTGVYMHASGGNLVFAATDSYRLAEKRLSGKNPDIGALVPATALAEVLRIQAEDNDMVTIKVDEGQALFKVEDVEITSRLIDGSFPEYQQLIPEKGETSFVVSRQEFISITKVASLFARESAGSVTLSVSEKNKEISIRSIASQVGENTSKASATVKGEGEVTLNSRYLLDALNAFEEENIEFSFSGKLKPCVIRQTDKQKDYQHIIMPLKS